MLIDLGSVVIWMSIHISSLCHQPELMVIEQASLPRVRRNEVRYDILSQRSIPPPPKVGSKNGKLESDDEKRKFETNMTSRLYREIHFRSLVRPE